MPAKLSRALRDTLRLKSQLPLLGKSPMRHSEIYYLLHEYDSLAIQANTLVSESLPVHSQLQLFLTKLRYVKISLNGEELQRLGISTGPELGEILQTLHKAKLDGEVKTKADEENLALSLKRSRSPKGRG